MKKDRQIMKCLVNEGWKLDDVNLMSQHNARNEA